MSQLTEQLIREMQRRVRDLEEQNARLRECVEWLRDQFVSEFFTVPEDDPPQFASFALGTRLAPTGGVPCKEDLQP